MAALQRWVAEGQRPLLVGNCPAPPRGFKRP